MRDQNTPLTFDLGFELYDALQTLKKNGGYRSTSRIILQAIEAFDYSGIERCGSQHKQVSVRIPSELRGQLQQIAKEAGISVGHLIRKSLVEFLENHSDVTEIPSADQASSPSAAVPIPSHAPFKIAVTHESGQRLVHSNMVKPRLP